MAFGADSPIAFEVHVDDVTFSVGYDPSQSVEKLFVYCRFGAIPEHDTVQVLQRLLQVNLSLAWQLRATLGVDAETNEVVYLFSEAVGAVDAQSLRDAMVRVAEQARRWRKTYFLDEAEAPAQSDMTQGAWMPGILA